MEALTNTMSAVITLKSNRARAKRLPSTYMVSGKLSGWQKLFGRKG